MKSTKTWYCYLLQCKDGTLYTGMSTDPLRRLRQHNGEISGGAGYTRRRKRRPSNLLCYAEIGTASMAANVERQIKKMPRVEKCALVRVWQHNMRSRGLGDKISDLRLDLPMAR
jgi:putative endonuclease